MVSVQCGKGGWKGVLGMPALPVCLVVVMLGHSVESDSL